MPIEALAGLLKEREGWMKICLGIGDIRMTQIGCKQWQGRSRILSGVIDAVQIPCRKSMAKVVKPGIAPLDGLELQLPQKSAECRTHCVIVASSPSLIYEK